MSCLSELFWREGLSMDSSIFSDDDISDWRWPASSPRRCDRESAHVVPGPDHSTHRNSPVRSSSCNCSSSDELFFYCTEELGSESTSGVGTTFYTYESEFMSSHSAAPPPLPPQASSSGRCTYEDYNWAFQPQVCASSSRINSSSRNKDTHPSAIKISTLPHTFRTNALHHHHCDTASAGGSDRAFPPPIASLLTDRPLMRSFKSEGRFVLKKVTNVSRSLFRSTRENGHLRLDLLSCSFNHLESRYGLGASMSSALQEAPPVDSISIPSFWHHKHSYMKDKPIFYDWSRSPLPYSSILHPKPSLNYKSLCPPSKLQAIAMLMHPKDASASFVEESISSPSVPFQVEHLIKASETVGGNTAVVQPKPHIFALLKLLPSGLGLIIFEISKSKGSDNVTMYGMYIPKDFGFECGRMASMSPSHHRLNELLGVRSEFAKGKLSSFEDCKRNRYMEGVFSN